MDHLTHVLMIKRKKQITWCKNCRDAFNIKWLLETVTSKTNFLFNRQVYCQHNGIAMGSPLGPLLADKFMIKFEINLMRQLKQLGVIYWRRFVDDTFVPIRPDSNVLSIQSVLNDYHPDDIKFTFEQEEDMCLSFLDVIIKRTLSRKSGFFTTVYRKPTYTGLLTK